MIDNDETKPDAEKFDFASFPPDTLFHERRDKRERRTRADAKQGEVAPPRAPVERRARKERRRRIDPTTFEKQYSDDELEFMNAMQRYKVQTGQSFPTHGEVLKVAFSLGYRKLVPCYEDEPDPTEDADPALLHDLPTDVSMAMKTD